jgi:hypothetical protein
MNRFLACSIVESDSSALLIDHGISWLTPFGRPSPAAEGTYLWQWCCNPASHQLYIIFDQLG